MTQTTYQAVSKWPLARQEASRCFKRPFGSPTKILSSQPVQQPLRHAKAFIYIIHRIYNPQQILRTFLWPGVTSKFSKKQ